MWGKTPGPKKTSGRFKLVYYYILVPLSIASIGIFSYFFDELMVALYAIAVALIAGVSGHLLETKSVEKVATEREEMESTHATDIERLTVNLKLDHDAEKKKLMLTCDAEKMESQLRRLSKNLNDDTATFAIHMKINQTHYKFFTKKIIANHDGDDRYDEKARPIEEGMVGFALRNFGREGVFCTSFKDEHDKREKLLNTYCFPDNEKTEEMIHDRVRSCYCRPIVRGSGSGAWGVLFMTSELENAFCLEDDKPHKEIDDKVVEIIRVIEIGILGIGTENRIRPMSFDAP